MNKINIRFANSSDAKNILEIYAPYIISTAVTFEYEVPSLDQFKERIRGITEKYPYIVCEINGRIAGYAYTSEYMARAAYQWDVQASVYLAKEYHRCKIATALYFCLFEFLKEQGFYNIYAGITLPNEGSVNFHKACGFVPIGIFRNTGYKLGGWHDVMRLGKTLLDVKEFCVPRPLKNINQIDAQVVSNVFEKAKEFIWVT